MILKKPFDLMVYCTTYSEWLGLFDILQTFQYQLVITERIKEVIFQLLQTMFKGKTLVLYTGSNFKKPLIREASTRPTRWNTLGGLVPQCFDVLRRSCYFL